MKADGVAPQINKKNLPMALAARNFDKLNAVNAANAANAAESLANQLTQVFADDNNIVDPDLIKECKEIFTVYINNKDDSKDTDAAKIVQEIKHKGSMEDMPDDKPSQDGEPTKHQGAYYVKVGNNSQRTGIQLVDLLHKEGKLQVTFTCADSFPAIFRTDQALWRGLIERSAQLYMGPPIIKSAIHRPYVSSWFGAGIKRDQLDVGYHDLDRGLDDHEKLFLMAKIQHQLMRLQPESKYNDNNVHEIFMNLDAESLINGDYLKQKTPQNPDRQLKIQEADETLLKSKQQDLINKADELLPTLKRMYICTHGAQVLNSMKTNPDSIDSYVKLSKVFGHYAKRDKRFVKAPLTLSKDGNNIEASWQLFANSKSEDGGMMSGMKNMMINSMKALPNSACAKWYSLSSRKDANDFDDQRMLRVARDLLKQVKDNPSDDNVLRLASLVHIDSKDKLNALLPDSDNNTLWDKVQTLNSDNMQPPGKSDKAVNHNVKDADEAIEMQETKTLEHLRPNT